MSETTPRTVARQYVAEWMHRVLPELQDVAIHAIGRDERPDLWHPVNGRDAGSWGHTLFGHDGFSFMADFDRMPTDNRLLVVLRDLAVHEYAHVVLFGIEPPRPPRPPQPQEDDVDDDDETFAASYRHLVATYCPWFDHADDFIRIMLHIGHRSTRADWMGRMFPWNVMAAGPMYGLSDISEYIVALGDEPQRCEGMTLTDVARTPIPAVFGAFFRWDTSR